MKADDFTVGQDVRVDAFNASRPGVVVKVGRTTVTVDYVKNRSGERATRTFPVRAVRAGDRS